MSDETLSVIIGLFRFGAGVIFLLLAAVYALEDWATNTKKQ